MSDGIKRPDHWQRSPESLNAIADLSDRQVRNRTLYQLGLATFALQAIADSVDRVASALEAITSVDLDTVEAVQDKIGATLVDTDPRIAGRTWDQKGPS